MDRREFLAAAGLSVLAGCSSGDGNSGGTNEEPTRSPSTTTPLTTVSEPDTEAPTTTADEVETDTETPEATETQTRTAVEARIDTASGKLDEVVAAYVEYATTEDATLSDVTAASTEFSPGVVQQETNEALQAINDADRINNGEYDSAIEALRNVRLFLKYAIEVQGHLVEAYESLESARESYNDGSYTGIKNAASSMRAKAADADIVVSDLKSDTDTSGLDRVRSLGRERYERKIDQFEIEIESFFELYDGLTDFADGLLSYAISSEEYNDRDDDYYSFENEKLNAARDRLAEAPKPDSTAYHVEAFECRAGAYAEAAVFMDSAARARDSNDVDSAIDYEAKAEESLEQCSS